MKELITKKALFVPDEHGDMVLAQNAIDTIVNIETQMKALDKEYRKYKTALKEGMEEYGLKSVDSDDLLITYVEPTESISIDQKKLWAEHKDVAFECQRFVQRNGYVKVTVR